MREQVTLNGKEQKRLKVLNDLEAGMMTMVQASKALGLYHANPRISVITHLTSVGGRSGLPAVL